MQFHPICRVACPNLRVRYHVAQQGNLPQSVPRTPPRFGAPRCRGCDRQIPRSRPALCDECSSSSMASIAQLRRSVEQQDAGQRMCRRYRGHELRGLVPRGRGAHGEQHPQDHPHRPEARKEVAAFLGQRAPSDAREPASMTTLTAERCGADSNGSRRAMTPQTGD